MNVYLTSLIGFFVLFCCYGCANKVSLTGGEKDEVPPKIITSTPINKSIDFSSDEINIEFDEIIQLKNTSQIVISPVLNGVIKYQAAGKSLKVKLPENLRDSTTYTINFNGSIVDNNESNALQGYNYVFSTYSSIDTGIVKGNCIDAVTKEPLDQILVGLYVQKAFLVDSLKPLYISKTNESGDFEIHGIRSGYYFLRAIKDDNRDYKLQKTELFGFSIEPNRVDSVLDSLSIVLSTNRNNAISYDILTNEFTNPLIVLSKPSEKILIESLENSNVKYRVNTLRDTITILSSVRDTSILLSLKEKKIDTVFISGIANSKEENSGISLSIKSEKVKGNRATIICNSRIDSFRVEGIHLFRDSIELYTDSIRLGYRNNIHVYFTKPEELNGAKIVVDSASVYSESICNNVFDNPIAFVNSDDLGTIEFTIEEKLEGSLIAILEDKAGVIQGYKNINAGIASIQFNRLYQGEYFLRLIYDVNSNKVWDSADFESMIPAEKIEILGPYRLEQGWDLLGNRIELN
ncbi:MAG: Ig-like domain-containing protein [Bacteroidia bacterium]